MGGGRRDDSVSPRRRRQPSGRVDVNNHDSSVRSASVSPVRRQWRNATSPSPRRHFYQAPQTDRSAGKGGSVRDRELDLRLLNVTGDALQTRRTVMTTATAGVSVMSRSRTTPRPRWGAAGSSPTRSRRGRRALSTADRERQEAIDRENRILLRKILEQHHGVHRGPTSGVPTAASCRSYSPRRGRSSRQINEERLRHKMDYENLLLLQKIQNVKASDQIASSFRGMRLAYYCRS